MKKGVILAGVVVVAIIALTGVILLQSNTVKYSGSLDNESYTLDIDGSGFVLTHEIYEPNSYVVDLEIYEGKIYQGDLFVNNITTQVKMFGTLVSEYTVENMDVPFSEFHFIKNVNRGYIIDDIPVSLNGVSVKPILACVTTQDNYESKGECTTILLGSTKDDLAEKGIVEVYTDGSALTYDIDSSCIGDIDLNTVGRTDVTFTYGAGQTAVIPVEVVSFMCEYGPVEPLVTLDEAIEKGYITVEPADVYLTSPDWDSKEGERMVTLVSDAGDSKRIFLDFVPETNKEVRSYTIHDLDIYIEHGSPLGSFTFDMVLRNGKTYEDISTDSATVSGYDRNRLGTQVITIWYDRCAFNTAVYVYSTEQTIPIAARLVNNSITPPIVGNAVYYDAFGVDLSEYAIMVDMADGSKKFIPLTRSMIYTQYNEWVGPDTEGDIDCIFHANIEGFRYYEAGTISPDPLDDDLKTALTIRGMLSDHDSMMFDTTFGGYAVHWVIGFDRSGDYMMASDMGFTSKYTGKNITYSCGETDSLTLFFGSKHNDLNVDSPIIGPSKMVSKEHDERGRYTVTFSTVVTEEMATKLLPLGYNIGETVLFIVNYDYFTKETTSLTITGDGHAPVTMDFNYDPEVPIYSDKVYNLIERLETVTMTALYSDGTSLTLDVPRGMTDITFVCDEGHGLYKDQAGTMPFEIPYGGMTTSMVAYYI